MSKLKDKRVIGIAVLFVLLLIKVVTWEPSAPSPEVLQPLIQEAMDKTAQKLKAQKNEPATVPAAIVPSSIVDTIASQSPKPIKRLEFPSTRKTQTNIKVEISPKIPHVVEEKDSTPPLPRKLSSLFAYVRVHRLVLRTSVESVEGALKLLTLAEGLWARQKIKINFDWEVASAKTIINEEACITENGPNDFVLQSVKAELENCLYFGRVESISQLNDGSKMNDSEENKTTRIYFTAGNNFLTSYSYLSEDEQQKLTFFKKLQEPK